MNRDVLIVVTGNSVIKVDPWYPGETRHYDKKVWSRCRP